MRLTSAVLLAASALQECLCASIPALRHDASSRTTTPRQALLQDVVTLDEHSVSVRGERLFIYSGEFHPFRLPVPGLWLDVLQKIKSLGFNGVSFYVDWALVEGTEGTVTLDGIFDLQPFFDAAAEAGVYLIARPGPYINAEVSAGGFPGWTLRIPCILRSTCPEYENATRNYLASVGAAIAAAQITKGGPVILVQPENEYSTWPDVAEDAFPDEMNREYMAFVEQQLRDAGIVVPFIDNDNEVWGSFASGTGLGAVDLYGIDAYPMRYDCADPQTWPTYRWPQGWQITHQEQSPSTPFSIPEFQGGSGTSWGSVSQDMCAALVGPEAIRVVYKNNYSFGVKLMSIYMTYGGTNWGNLGYMGGDSSYDYGAAINEYRQVWREKYSEQKLQANFFKVTPAYLTASAGNATNGTYASTKNVSTTPLWGANGTNGTNGTNFYVVRQADFTSTTTIHYSITLPSTSVGNVTVPQLGGTLSLLGRDSKLMVTDYDVGGVNLVYSTADLFTWAKNTAGKTVLVLYGTAGELHEFAIASTGGGAPRSVDDLFPQWKAQQKEGMWIVQWRVVPEQQIILFDSLGLEIRLLWRNDAYNYWVLELPSPQSVGNYSSPSKSSVVVKGGYLLRTASIEGSQLSLTGDFNSTTELEVVFEPTANVDCLRVNGVPTLTWRSLTGSLTSIIVYIPPLFQLPDLADREWKTIDSLPEVQSGYDDSAWNVCNNNVSSNNQLSLQTPTSLYASDYGYHTGSLLYRGHFTANGRESSLFLNVSGGSAFSHSVFLDSAFLGSWVGNPNNQTYAQTFPVSPLLTPGRSYVFTVLIDHMGQTEEAPGTDAVKFPMGILDFTLAGHAQEDVTWKMTGNLGGEQNRDPARGPRNEGAMFAERQGYHLPYPPCQNWTSSSPVRNGLDAPGITFYTTSFELDIPSEYDVPMAVVFANSNSTWGSDATATTGLYRVQLFVNGYQFGKFIPYLGPQSEFPVPEGILNYHGTNYLSLTLWALGPGGAKLSGIRLEPMMPVLSGAARPSLSPMPAWTLRENAY